MIIPISLSSARSFLKDIFRRLSRDWWNWIITTLIISRCRVALHVAGHSVKLHTAVLLLNSISRNFYCIPQLESYRLSTDLHRKAYIYQRNHCSMTARSLPDAARGRSHVSEPKLINIFPQTRTKANFIKSLSRKTIHINPISPYFCSLHKAAETRHFC